jgi:hypothetical protein
MNSESMQNELKEMTDAKKQLILKEIVEGRMS